MTTLSDIGAAIRRHRKQCGLTLVALAEKSGVHRNTLSALEKGSGNVELNTLLAICEQLGLEFSLIPQQFSYFVNKAAFPNALFLASSPHAGEAANKDRRYSVLQQRIADRLAQADMVLDNGSTVSVVELKTPASSFTLRPGGSSKAEEPTALQKRIAARLAAAAGTDRKNKP